MGKISEYKPTNVSIPGETLLDVLKEIGMSQVELSKRMGRPFKTINEIIKGKAVITPETALQLETVLDIPASFWLNRQNKYNESVARVQHVEKLHQFTSWLNNFPLKEMKKYFGLLKEEKKVDQVKELLTFFSVASPDLWDKYFTSLVINYRDSKIYDKGKEALSVWLRLGEIEANKIECAEFNKSLFKEMLNEIRSLTTQNPEDFESKMKEYCASSGVAHVIIPELPKTRVCGATRWLTSNKALIQQNLRYKTNDQFWFTFFHEAAHILLHSDKDLILEFEGNRNKYEEDADNFAANFLIPSKEYEKFLLDDNITKSSIKSFADSVGITPGIVVGRLQHEGKIKYSWFNELKVKFRWSEN